MIEAQKETRPSRYCLIGPTYPYRGGIAHYTTLLTQQLRLERETLLISFSRQYPNWLFPGKSDKDPSKRPLQTDADYLLDPLNPIAWRKTLRRIAAWKADTVIIPWWHPYFAPAWSALGRGVKRLPHPPRLLFICHNVLPHEQGKISRAALPAVLKFTLRPGDGFIVHSESDGRILHNLLPSAAYRVSPHPTYGAIGGDGGGALPAAVPDDRPLLLFAGFIRPYKGLDILLEAMALLKRPLHLLVVGEFWQGGEPLYRRQIERLSIGDAVTIVDEYVTDETLAACLQRADTAVLPYRSATQSGIIQAAFGHGCPVITTNVGGLKEAVENGRTGLVVEPENPAALAAAIERYFAEGLGEIFRQNLKEKANPRFSWQTLIETISILEKGAF